MTGHRLSEIYSPRIVSAFNAAAGYALFEYNVSAFTPFYHGVTHSFFSCSRYFPCCSMAFMPFRKGKVLPYHKFYQAPAARLFSSGAPKSPFTQHAPLHAPRSQTNFLSSSSSETSVFPIAIISSEFILNKSPATTFDPPLLVYSCQ
jgi:hypothetical protein